MIDERLDIALLAHLAALRPDWQIVLVGPVAKLDPQILPKARNIHYLGGKICRASSLSRRVDVALMPFARNDATRFHQPDQNAGVSGGRADRWSPHRSPMWCAITAM